MTTYFLNTFIVLKQIHIKIQHRTVNKCVIIFHYTVTVSRKYKVGVLNYSSATFCLKFGATIQSRPVEHRKWPCHSVFSDVSLFQLTPVYLTVQQMELQVGAISLLCCATLMFCSCFQVRNETSFPVELPVTCDVATREFTHV